MNRHAKEVVAIATTQLGFTFEGYDGNGHVVLSLPDGRRTSIPATPSEYRSTRNQLASLERMSGRKLPRVKAGRSRKADKVSGFSLERAHSESQRWHAAWDDQIERLCQERDRLIAECRESARSGKRDRICLLADAIRRIADIEGELIDTYHQPVERFDPYTLAAS